MISYDVFRGALKELEFFWKRYQERLAADDGDELDMDMRKAAVVQAFEFCQQEVFRALRRHVTESLAITNLSDGIIRVAYENDLLSSSPDEWQKYVDARNQTSHGYDKTKADVILEIVPDFIDDCIGVHQTLTGKTWE